jgi:hypothetical protein
MLCRSCMCCPSPAAALKALGHFRRAGSHTFPCELPTGITFAGRNLAHVRLPMVYIIDRSNIWERHSADWASWLLLAEETHSQTSVHTC